MPHVSQTIGSAKIIRGDALIILPTLEPGSFGAVVADPPYCSGGDVRNRDRPTSAKYQSSAERGLYPEFSGDARDQRSFLAWSTLWMSAARSALRPGALFVVFTDWRQLPVTTDALQCAGLTWRGVVVWDKTEGARPQFGRYRNQSEFAVWGTNGPRPLRGKIAPGVIRQCVARRKLHIAGKPVEMLETLLEPVEGPVLDPFMGSGSVGMACRRHGLGYLGVEIEASYYEIASRRLSESS